MVDKSAGRKAVDLAALLAVLKVAWMAYYLVVSMGKN